MKSLNFISLHVIYPFDEISVIIVPQLKEFDFGDSLSFRLPKKEAISVKPFLSGTEIVIYTKSLIP